MERLIGYRKLALTGSVFVISIFMLWGGLLNADQFVELNKFVIPSFLAANLIEHVMDGKRQESKE